jgi:hypothetical protein
MKTIVYVALLKDDDFTSDEVMTVQTSKEKIEEYIKDYFGISNVKKYDKPAEYLGFTKYEYSEFEDDVVGFYTFKDGEEISKVYLFSKILDEKP